MNHAATVVRRLISFTLIVIVTSTAECDETHIRYFEQLRQRGLYSLAESEAISRLAVDNPSLTSMTGFSIELSRTLAEHAGYVADEQRNEFWQRARSTIQELLEREPANPRVMLLRGQIASVYAVEGDWLRGEREVRPFDEALRTQATEACSRAIEELQGVEKELAEPSRGSNAKKYATDAPSGFELRSQMHQARWQLGLSYRNRSELAPPGSSSRIADLAEAEQTLRRLVSVADEPLRSRVKVLQATCYRLQGERDRAFEILDGLINSNPKPGDAIQNEITVERVRLLLDARRPTDGVEVLLKVRSQRQRLTGELWYLQTRSLIALRTVTLEKQEKPLGERLVEQITTAINRCDEQVGGYWTRRCRQVWDNTQTAEKYGEELDSLMQQARADFNSRRVDVALAEYASAEKLAGERGQPELAMNLGFTRGSIMLDEKQFETASTEFLRLASQYPVHQNAAKAHLLAAYCLGRMYDEKKTQPRREAYTEALDGHLKNYSSDPTVNEARFLKAQLEEQRLQATAALPLYLSVEDNHPRAPDAVAGAARCYETILQRMVDRGLPTDDLEREAIDRLSRFLSNIDDNVESWSLTHAEIAFRLATILLREKSDQTQPNHSELTTAPHQKKPIQSTQSGRYRQAERWLEHVHQFADRKDLGTTIAVVADRLRQQAAPLMILALAGGGNVAEAERRLKALPSLPEMLTVASRLSPLIAEIPDKQRRRLAEVQLQAAERIALQRDQLSRADADQLDLILMKAYVASGQVLKGVTFAQRLAEKFAKDVERQREIALIFSDVIQSDANSLAKQCWRRVESQSKAGSVEWLTARLGVMNCCVQLRQFEEGRKLLQVTKVLYPELGGDSLVAKFAIIEKSLNEGKSISR